MTHDRCWWEAEEGQVYKSLLPYVRTVESRQSDYFDRFLMHEAHYDPNGPAAEWADAGYLRRLRGIKENVVAVACDTVRATIAATEIRVRFMTDDADWSTAKRAESLELYAEELTKLLKIGDACRAAFFACTKKGTGLVKVYADQDKQIRVEPVMVDNIIVDDRECANGAPPRQLHYRQADFDCDLLCQQFPDHRDAIMKARGRTPAGWRRPRVGPGETRNDVLVVESWRLPLGDPSTRDEEGTRYVPGRHAICIEGADLLVEEWHEPHFGMAEVRYFERDGSWYGGSLAERIIGHQRVLDRRNHQRDRQLDYAVPTLFVNHIDQNLRIQTTQAGNVIPHKGERPQMVVPGVVGAEIANDRLDARASAIAEIGLSEIATRGQKPSGIESGAGLREFKDQTSQRFSMQERAFEALWLRVVELALGVCKQLDGDAPAMSRQTRFGPRKVKWSDVEMTDVRVQIAAASTLARTPAGRVQTVLELSQAGAITMDETRDLLEHPDLSKNRSLYTASLKAIEHDLELIEEGEYVMPEPFINLDLAQRYAQNRYLIDRDAGAPEHVLEGLRTYAVQVAHMTAMAANSNAAPMPAAQPLPPVDLPALPPGAEPPMAAPQQVPSAAPPTLPAPSSPMAA